MEKNEIIKEIMHKVHKSLVFESMAGKNTGDKMATFSELCGEMIAGIEEMLNIHIKDAVTKPLNVGQCWNCDYRAGLLMCQHRDYFMKIEQYCQCPEWKQGSKGEEA